MLVGSSLSLSLSLTVSLTLNYQLAAKQNVDFHADYEATSFPCKDWAQRRETTRRQSDRTVLLSHVRRTSDSLQGCILGNRNSAFGTSLGVLVSWDY